MKKNQKDVSKSSTKAKKSAKTNKVKKPNKIFKFFRELKAEVKKVVWPTKKQVLNNTGVVLIAMSVSGLFIWGVDSLLKVIFDVVLGR